VCLEMHLIVEVDGGQHQDSQQDRLRDRRLHEAGFRVLRFWNNQVLQETDEVVDAIGTALLDESKLLPRQGGGWEGDGGKMDCPIPTLALPLKGRESL
jgi:hypothetical protein